MFMLFAVSVKARPRLRVFCMEKYGESLQITHNSQTCKSMVTVSGSVSMHSDGNGKKLIGDIFYFHVAYL
jgi:hypothetical protein